MPTTSSSPRDSRGAKKSPELCHPDGSPLDPTDLVSIVNSLVKIENEKYDLEAKEVLCQARHVDGHMLNITSPFLPCPDDPTWFPRRCFLAVSDRIITEEEWETAIKRYSGVIKRCAVAGLITEEEVQLPRSKMTAIFPDFRAEGSEDDEDSEDTQSSKSMSGSNSESDDIISATLMIDTNSVGQGVNPAVANAKGTVALRNQEQLQPESLGALAKTSSSTSSASGSTQPTSSASSSRAQRQRIPMLFTNDYVDILTVEGAKARGYYTADVAAPSDKRAKYMEVQKKRYHVFCGAHTLQKTNLLDEEGSGDSKNDLVILVKAPFREQAIGMFGVKKDFDLFVETMTTCHALMAGYSGTIFIACQTGRTRSAAILMAYLVLEYKWPVVAVKRQVNAALLHRGSDADYRADRNNIYTIGIQALKLGITDFATISAMRLGEDINSMPTEADAEPRFADRLEQEDTQQDDLVDENDEYGDFSNVTRQGGLRHLLLSVVDPVTFSEERRGIRFFSSSLHLFNLHLSILCCVLVSLCYLSHRWG
jgi:protein-tyrosine phosphatase